jgi:hypothetical protein
MLRVPDQEQRAHQASLRAEEALHACSYGPMRKAERKAMETTHRSEEELGWRIEVGGIWPRSLPISRPERE